MVQGGTFKNDAVLRSLESVPRARGRAGALPRRHGRHRSSAHRQAQARGRRGVHRIDVHRARRDGRLLLHARVEQPLPVLRKPLQPHAHRLLRRLHLRYGQPLRARRDRRRSARRGGAPPAARDQGGLPGDARPVRLPPEAPLRGGAHPRARPHAKRGHRAALRPGAAGTTMPFWRTLLLSLGFSVHVSGPSTHELYERGLPNVPSDTVCFPAKLVHGHLRDLADAGVDRIFMPIITTVPTENVQDTSLWMCAVVKGYPLVVRNSDNPEKRFGHPLRRAAVPLVFRQGPRPPAHRLPARGVRRSRSDRAACRSARRMRRSGRSAIASSSAAPRSSRRRAAPAPTPSCWLRAPTTTTRWSTTGFRACSRAGASPCSRPTRCPGATEVDLSMSRLDIVNNFHARMLGTALIAAGDPALEYVQLVSFGCGHDAYLSDEIVRLMHEASGGSKTPLILKVDESDVDRPAAHPRALVRRDRRRAPRRPQPHLRTLRRARAARPVSGQIHQGGPPRQGRARAQHLACVLPS